MSEIDGPMETVRTPVTPAVFLAQFALFMALAVPSAFSFSNKVGVGRRATLTTASIAAPLR